MGSYSAVLDLQCIAPDQVFLDTNAQARSIRNRYDIIAERKTVHEQIGQEPWTIQFRRQHQV